MQANVSSIHAGTPQRQTIDLQELPSEELVNRLKALLHAYKEPHAPQEAFRGFLTDSLKAVLDKPSLHWWCHSELRPTSKELLHLYSLDENEPLIRYKAVMENLIASCLDCSQEYYGVRLEYLAELRTVHEAEVVEGFFRRLLEWDCNRLENRLRSLISAPPHLHKRRKYCIVEFLLDPSLLRDPVFSARIAAPFINVLSQALSNKRIKLQGMLPGLWLLSLHQNPMIQSWAADTNVSSSKAELISVQQWESSRHFQDIWRMSLGLMKGSQDHLGSTLLFTEDQDQIWRGTRSMLTSMSAEVTKLMIKSNREAWTIIQLRLLDSVQGDAMHPPGFFIDICRTLFVLLKNLKHDFWTVNGAFRFANAGEAEQFLRSLILHPGIQEYAASHIADARRRRDITKAPPTSAFNDLREWLSHFVNSLSFFNRRNVVLSVAGILMDVVHQRMNSRVEHAFKSRQGQAETCPSADLLEFDLELIKISFDLILEQPSGAMPLTAKVLSRRWTWLSRLCTLGSTAVSTAGLSAMTVDTVHILVARAVSSGRKILLDLVDWDVELMWGNYVNATALLVTGSAATLESSQQEMWLRLAQSIAVPKNDISLNPLDQKSMDDRREWQTSLVEHYSKLAFLPNLVVKASYKVDSVSMCEAFNDDLSEIHRAAAVLLEGLVQHGKDWLNRMANAGNKIFIVKTLRFWCSPDRKVREQALLVLGTAWQESERSACLRCALEIGEEQSMKEIIEILSDFRTRGCPGGDTPLTLFQFLLDSVTTLFLNNAIDGEGGLYLQIFLGLTSSQEVARHVSLIKNLWDSIWKAVTAGLTEGRTTWKDRMDRGSTIEAIKIILDVGLLMIGKIQYFDRLLEFEKQETDNDGDQDMDAFDEPLKPSTQKGETMPLDDMKAAVPRIVDWMHAQDVSVCSSAFDLVCSALNLLADHGAIIDDREYQRLSNVSSDQATVKTLLTEEQREALWITLSRHATYSSGLDQSIMVSAGFGAGYGMEVSSTSSSAAAVRASGQSTAVSEPIEISDDDFDDLEVDLTNFDDDEDDITEEPDKEPTAYRSASPAVLPAVQRSIVDYRLKGPNPYQTKLSFAPATGAAAAPVIKPRQLPPSLNSFNVNITPKAAPKRAPPVKKGHKLSQMRADHRKERRSIVDATQQARQVSRISQVAHPVATKPMPHTSGSDSASESDSDGDNGLSSLVDAEEKFNSSKKNKENQAPRKTMLLELSEVIKPSNATDLLAQRRRAAAEAMQRQQRLTPNLAALHKQILRWEVSATGDRPPGGKEYVKVPSTFDSVGAYIRTYEPLLVLECWQQYISAKEESNISSDSVIATFASRVSIDDFQDMIMKIPQDKANSMSPEDIVVVSDPSVKDIFTASGNAARAKPFLAKVQSVSRGKKGECDVVFRACLKIEESSALMHVRPNTKWNILKLLNLVPTHREYSALIAMQHYELCSRILNPPDEQAFRPPLNMVQNVMDTYKVNTPQAQAIIGAVEKTEGFTLIQGPPGTGKTKTILGLVGALLMDGTKARAAPVVQSSKSSERILQTGTVPRILVCAPSNAAIDEIVKRLKGGIRNTMGDLVIPKVVRVGSLETVNAEVKDVALETLISKELESKSSSKDKIQSANQAMGEMRKKMTELTGELEKARLELVQANESSNALAASASGDKIKALNQAKWKLGRELDAARENSNEAAQLRDQARKDARNKILGEADIICSTLSASGHDLLTSATFSFETVIIDEAAQSVEISSLIPLKYGCKRCIMVGDPNQLPPTVISQLATKFEYNQSLFVRIQTLAPSSVHLLSIQYRMHPDISLFPSREFYKSKLKDGPDMALKTKAEWHAEPLFSPYRFFDVYDGVEKIGLSHSQHNPVEAQAAVRLLEKLITAYPKLNFFRRVGVISPYKQQVRTLKQHFSDRFGSGVLDAIDFNTVDGFQGQEKDIIIFSCVRASQYGSVGFLADIRRMNVALTRARQSIFILGHADTLRREKIWGDLVRDAEDRDLVTRLTPDVFGRGRSSAVPNNLLQANPEAADRRNDLYGKLSSGLKASYIDRPMVNLDDVVMHDTPEPSITGSSDARTGPHQHGISNDARPLRPHPSRPDSYQGGRSDSRDPRARDRAPEQHSRDFERRDRDLDQRSRDPESRRRNDEARRDPPGHLSGNKRKSSLSVDLDQDLNKPRMDEPYHKRHEQERGRTVVPSHEPPSSSSSSSRPLVDQPAVSSSSSTVKHPLPPRPPPVKKPASLFLKSKPMSMKPTTSNGRQHEIPTRERLASQVIPIRKSYPSGGSNQAPRRPLPKKPPGPSLDDILNGMKK